MKAIPAALKTHLEGEVTTLATCWKATRRDGTVLGFTDHDKDIVVGGLTYVASSGYTASAIVTTAALDVDNLELDGMLRAPSITEGDLAAGLWDFAGVEIFLVNWADPSQGTLKQRKGWLGEVRAGRAIFTAELRGLTQPLQQEIGEVYSPSCKADLFDTRCKLADAEGVWKFTGQTVSTIVSAQRQWTDSGLAQAADFFTAGKVLWLTGANAGLYKEIKSNAGGGNILLQEPMPYVIAAGDSYTIWAGCRKRYAEDCGAAKFNNQVNFRGFPHLPGQDDMLRGPQ